MKNCKSGAKIEKYPPVKQAYTRYSGMKFEAEVPI